MTNVAETERDNITSTQREDMTAPGFASVDRDKSEKRKVYADKTLAK